LPSNTNGNGLHSRHQAVIKASKKIAFRAAKDLKEAV
jgi:nucleoid DNA-binding protein